eukprot:CAMPEP_0179019988 /NCGR_PEP_ID=MMETSP0796-20121207/5150_1 /TAXON_ID=73915 /ORGANISM="Pyrodinium bahamense, Strain pbaha01" /LENGTH=406 /DNA_ID=CAMNT_0020715789 /DNA_START=42 /DNA_END=1259 /DNA_ORIENTATION=-
MALACMAGNAAEHATMRVGARDATERHDASRRPVTMHYTGSGRFGQPQAVFAGLASIPTPPRGHVAVEQGGAAKLPAQSRPEPRKPRFTSYREQLRMSGAHALRSVTDCRLAPEVASDLASMTQQAPTCRDPEAYEKMWRSLLADSMYFPDYSARELDLIAEFLGQMLNFNLLPPGPPLCSALQCIIGALRSPKGSKMLRFALRTLEPLQARLGDFPSLVEELGRHPLYKCAQSPEATSVAYIGKAAPNAFAGKSVHQLQPSPTGEACLLFAPIAAASPAEVHPAVPLPMYVRSPWAPQGPATPSPVGLQPPSSEVWLAEALRQQPVARGPVLDAAGQPEGVPSRPGVKAQEGGGSGECPGVAGRPARTADRQRGRVSQPFQGQGTRTAAGAPLRRQRRRQQQQQQ